MLEVIIMKHEAQHLALQPCLDGIAIRDTRGLENSTLSSSRWMLMVLARARCGPSVVQVPWPQLSTEGESRPFDITWKGLVQPSSSLITSESIPRTCSSPWGFDSEGAKNFGGVAPPSTTPHCQPLRCPLKVITTRTRSGF
jgi:hypothetical protein